MGSAAVQAAKAVNYIGAGTVEFIVDASDGLRPDRFYFMEMNTRLQVEHPVTEMVTGVDLVEWQINVALGKPLPVSQDQLSINGHAVEARIYAEDTDNDFLPASGTLEYMYLDSGARIDSGVRQGDFISPYYDPMIAKLIVKGEDRNAAVANLAAVLNRSRVAGCVTNIGFLGRLVSLPRFIDGDVETGLIEQERKKLSRPDHPPAAVLALGALHNIGVLAKPYDTNPWQVLTHWRPWGYPTFLVSSRCQNEVYHLRLDVISSSRFRVKIGDSEIELELGDVSTHDVQLAIDDQWLNLGISAGIHRLNVFYDGESWLLNFDDPLEVTADSSTDANHVTAPMPGVITHISIEPGGSVTTGDTLIVMEAMKMEHSLKAGRDGKVESVSVATGDQVEAGAALVKLEPGGE
jgi:3-methylcrotonyl-CoA carboxylase alpha subunit